MWTTVPTSPASSFSPGKSSVKTTQSCSLMFFTHPKDTRSSAAAQFPRRNPAGSRISDKIWQRNERQRNEKKDSLLYSPASHSPASHSIVFPWAAFAFALIAVSMPRVNAIPPPRRCQPQPHWRRWWWTRCWHPGKAASIRPRPVMSSTASPTTLTRRTNGASNTALFRSRPFQ